MWKRLYPGYPLIQHSNKIVIFFKKSEKITLNTLLNSGEWLDAHTQEATSVTLQQNQLSVTVSANGVKVLLLNKALNNAHLLSKISH